MRRILALAIVLPAALLTSGCANAIIEYQAELNEKLAAPPVISAECDLAAATSLEVTQNLYDTHPLWDAEMPSAESSPEEWAAYDALQADENAQWTAAQAPIFDACKSVEEWLAVAKKYPGIVGMIGSEFVDTSALEAQCRETPAVAACSNIDEWLAENASAYDF